MSDHICTCTWAVGAGPDSDCPTHGIKCEHGKPTPHEVWIPNDDGTTTVLHCPGTICPECGALMADSPHEPSRVCVRCEHKDAFRKRPPEAVRNPGGLSDFELDNLPKPSRDEIAAAIHESIQREAPNEFVGPCYDQADAVLALFNKS